MASILRGVVACCLVGMLATTVQGQTRLTTDGRVKSDPTFVDRSGTEVAFVVQESATLMRLMRLKLSDGSVVPVNPELQKNEFEPAYSLDGSLLVTAQSRGNLSMALVLRNVATGTEIELKPEGGFCGYRCPAVAPDMQRVFYSFADDDRQTIVSMNRQGTDKKSIIPGPGHANWPSVSPDGKRLAFGSTRDGNYEIYTANVDGSDVRRLTDHPRQDVRPRISPDGKRIAFTSARDGNYEIYVMNVDGSNLVRITNHPERDDYATWHPDGERLVIVSERGGQHDLYVVDVR